MSFPVSGRSELLFSIGHKANEDIWWKTRDGDIKTSKDPAHMANSEFEAEHEEDAIQSRGRVVHDSKEISVLSHDQTPMRGKSVRLPRRSSWSINIPDTPHTSRVRVA